MLGGDCHLLVADGDVVHFICHTISLALDLFVGDVARDVVLRQHLVSDVDLLDRSEVCYCTSNEKAPISRPSFASHQHFTSQP